MRKRRTSSRAASERILVERGFDQAHGLRRMFSQAPARVIDIVAGHAAVGRTSVAVNLAAALGRRGRSTLLVDVIGASGEGRALHYLGLAAEGIYRHDASAHVSPQAGNVAVVEVRPSSATAHNASRVESDAVATIAREAPTRDCVLVSSLAAERIVVGAQGRRDVIVVLSPLATSITAAYALVKRLAFAAGECRFGVVVNRADSRAAALRIFRGMARVADSYLNVRIDLVGFIPPDACVQRAVAQGRSVVDWTPRAPAAQAFRDLAETIGHWPTRAVDRIDGHGESKPVAPLPLAI